MSEWMNVVKKTMAKNKGKPFREILKLAKEEYKLIKDGVVQGAKVVGSVANKQAKLIKKTGRRITRRFRGGKFPSSTPEELVPMEGGRRRTRRARTRRARA